ncbi:MAG: tRNA (guanosine(46)-N7)-methyltransferase TrmB [Gammaproteobacteria bacterium]|nr:MAG: tRNA (guanosine(46)-N7)-methyltransferase TrmB [Gammaproteobacteria bacterium]
MSEPQQPQPKPEYKERRIRSFVRRQGRLTEGQSRALHDHWQDYGLELSNGRLDMAGCFGREAPVILEIGFGNGDSLLSMAERQPGKDFIGIEVHRPGVGALINNAQRLGVHNIRVYCDDAIEVLKQAIPDNSLAGVQLFFPDPWHKKRHHKRRIVQPAFAETIATKLQAGGYFHMATDWQNYAEHMMAVMSACELYENKMGGENYAPRPDYRPETKFERRGIRLGHGVWDLIFIKK